MRRRSWNCRDSELPELETRTAGGGRGAGGLAVGCRVPSFDFRKFGGRLWKGGVCFRRGWRVRPCTRFTARGEDLQTPPAPRLATRRGTGRSVAAAPVALAARRWPLAALAAVRRACGGLWLLLRRWRRLCAPVASCRSSWASSSSGGCAGGWSCGAAFALCVSSSEFRGLAVRAADTLENVPTWDISGYFLRRLMKRWAVDLVMPRSSRPERQPPCGSCSLMRMSASPASQASSTVRRAYCWKACRCSSASCQSAISCSAMP